MNKNEFLSALRSNLSGLSSEDIERSLEYYSEIIDDAVEEGISEEMAISELGTPDEISAQILVEMPLPKLVKAKAKQNRALKVWEIILLVLGSPVWLSLLIAAIAALLSVYAVMWSAVICLYTVFISLIACAFVGILGAVPFFVKGSFPEGLVFSGLGLVCAGLSVLMLFVTNASVKGLILLTKKISIGIKYIFVGRGRKE